MNTVMHAKDTISGKKAVCFITIDGNRYNFMQAINVQADFKKKKTTVPILGKMGEGNKAAGWSGTGSATFHYNTSIFRELLERYKETGEDIYFEMQITNEDPTSNSGMQTCVLVDCNIDDGVLVQFDANSDRLEESFNFTFEDFYYPDKFNLLDGMQ